MSKEATISEIKKYLARQDDVVFAYVFGSFVKRKAFRDIDIAIYINSEIDLLRLGSIQSELTELTGENIDLVLLNGLPGKNPAFAHEIVTHGELLFTTHQEKFVHYKRKALLFFFDTARLREGVQGAFAKRLESGKFGHRNYV